MKQLVINESKWYRGNGGKESRLLKMDGMMCCLGFYCLDCGVESNDILEVGFPSQIEADVPREIGWLIKLDKDKVEIQDIIATINDDPSITDEERKTKLANLFGEHGVEVAFVP